MRNFELVKEYNGYVTKTDPTNTDEQNLVLGSQNVIINDAEKVVSRKGITRFGATATTDDPIEASFEWNTSTATELPLRSWDDELEVYVGSVGTRDFNAWYRLKDGYTSVAFNFATWWDNSEKIDKLLFVNGSDDIEEWSGAFATFASATSNTLTLEGTSTWAERRFLTAGTRTLKVLDDGGTWRSVAYTGGESTTTLTGVDDDLTAYTISAGALVMQEVRTNTNQPAANFSNDLIDVLNNQVHIGSLTDRTVYISKNTSFTDYTFSSPRVPGEGALLTLDNPPTGFVSDETAMYISAGTDDWYTVAFTLSGDTTAEAISIEKLKTAPQQAAQSQALIAKIKNAIVYISNEPTLDQLGRVENVDTPQSTDLSDPIKPDFEAATFTNGHVRYWRNQIFIALPSDSKVLIYDLSKGYWQPPQLLAIRRFAIIGGLLYGHSANGNETYKMFDGRNDLDTPIAYKAVFAYRSFGDRSNLKEFNEHFSELYATTNSKITLTLDYDFKGATSSQDFIIDASDEDITFQPNIGGALGSQPLGTQPLGGFLDGIDDFVKLRVIHTSRQVDFFEYRTTFYCDTLDGGFEVLSHGPNARISKRKPFNIKE